MRFAKSMKTAGAWAGAAVVGLCVWGAALTEAHGSIAPVATPQHPGTIVCADGSATAEIAAGGHWITRGARRDWRPGPLPLSELCPPIIIERP